MPGAPPPRNLDRRGRVWWARKGIPVNVRHLFGGKKWFLANTHETDPTRAAALAAPWLAEWDRRIEQARRSLQDPLKAEIERLANAYRRYRDKPLDDEGAVLVADVVEFVLERTGGLSAAQRRKALTDARGDVAEVIQSLKNADTVSAALGQIIGTATPFLAHLEVWQDDSPPQARHWRKRCPRSGSSRSRASTHRAVAGWACAEVD